MRRIGLSRFLKPIIGKFNSDKEFELTEDCIFDSRVLMRTITIKKGFKTDFASVPRLHIAYALFGGKENKAAAVHDYLYRLKSHICTRKQADLVFMEIMKLNGSNCFRRMAMYSAVRLFGGLAWRIK